MPKSERPRILLHGGLDLRPTSMPDPGQLIFQSKRVDSCAWNTDVAAHIPLADAHTGAPAFLTGANQGKVMLVP